MFPGRLRSCSASARELGAGEGEEMMEGDKPVDDRKKGEKVKRWKTKDREEIIEKRGKENRKAKERK